MVAKAAPLGKVRRLSIYLDENPDRLLSSRYENKWPRETLDVLSTEYCDLKDVAGLTNLRKLNIKLASSVENLEEILKSAGSSYEEQVRQIVSSCRHIYKLKLFGPTAELPKELHNYPNLAKLQLRRYGLKEDQTGILEKIPNLTTLRLINEAFEENTKILVFSKGGFPSLEFLFVYGMREITEWRVEEGAMPSLCRLHIEYCRGLTTLPKG
ncbi:putative disease resistance protein [Prunus yedoensis var. nudiflora]|uniref:Putative disease resistance protein n=1 Tax=Prunus yedoensis var. nudiflora TaxID=2094558 RepID=A0A314YJY4_PRUYE|nr:putative disease resistance protein [Prunus yedoensis var. nudiflora]